MKRILSMSVFLVLNMCNDSRSGPDFKSSNQFYQLMTESKISEIVKSMEFRQKAESLTIGYLGDLNFERPDGSSGYYYSYFENNRVIVKLVGRYGMLIVNSEWTNPININHPAVLDTKKEGRWALYFFYGNPLK